MTRFTLLALLIQGSAVAIELPEECRVENRGPMCAFAALETLGRTHGITALYGLRDDRYEKDPRGLTYDSTIADELSRRGVRYELRPQWSFDRSLLRRYANSHGVVVALKPGNNWSGGCHAVAVTRYDDEWVEFYDCNRTTQNGRAKIWRCPRRWFDEQGWMGSSVVVLKEEWH